MGKPHKINWNNQIRHAKRQMREARWIAGLPKNQRPPLHVSTDRAMQYRTQLPEPTQAAQLARLNRQATVQRSDTIAVRPEQASDGTAGVMPERAEITAPASAEAMEP